MSELISISITAKIPPDLCADLLNHAARHDIDPHTVIVEALSDYIGRAKAANPSREEWLRRLNLGPTQEPQ